MRLPFLLGPLVVVTLGAVGACADLKEGVDPAQITSDGGTAPVTVSDGGPKDAGGELVVSVETLASGRSRVGARSTAGFKAWRGGIAVRQDRVFWVESGTQPGLYAASSTPCADPATCSERLATFARPSAFAVSQDHMVVADVTVIKRFSFADPQPETVASGTAEVVNLATEVIGASAKVFWTSGTDSAIRFTAVGGTTSTPINSNGTPVGMALAGPRLFWVGVDISGQAGALQSIGTDGKGAREVSRFSSGFSAMGGNGTYLYYAKGLPAEIHRITLSSGRDEAVDRDAFGATDFAIDETYAYWTEPGDAPDYANGRVRRIAHDSSKAQGVGVSIPFPVALAVSGSRVFVASAGTSAKSFADGKILKLTIAP